MIEVEDLEKDKITFDNIFEMIYYVDPVSFQPKVEFSGYVDRFIVYHLINEGMTEDEIALNIGKAFLKKLSDTVE